jgi:hypothetical protein
MDRVGDTLYIGAEGDDFLAAYPKANNGPAPGSATPPVGCRP